MVKPRKLGTIDQAYCFELNVILDPYLALARGIQHHRYHLFCPTKGCGWKLEHRPWYRNAVTYEKAWFVSTENTTPKKRSHADGCPYGNDKHVPGPSGSGHKTDIGEPDNLAFPFIPGEILTGQRLTRHWPLKGVDDQTLQKLIANAEGLRLGGTIEEVVDAHEFLRDRWVEYKEREKKGEKLDVKEYSIKRWDLDIGGNATNYYEGIVDLSDQAKNLGNSKPWDTNVFRARALVKKTQNGTFRLYPTGKGFVIIIDPQASRGVPGKSYLPGLLEKIVKDAGKDHAAVTVYLWDLKPSPVSDGGRATIMIDQPDHFLRTAIRGILRPPT